MMKNERPQEQPTYVMKATKTTPPILIYEPPDEIAEQLIAQMWLDLIESARKRRAMSAS